MPDTSGHAAVTAEALNRLALGLGPVHMGLTEQRDTAIIIVVGAPGQLGGDVVHSWGERLDPAIAASNDALRLAVSNSGAAVVQPTQAGAVILAGSVELRGEHTERTAKQLTAHDPGIGALVCRRLELADRRVARLTTVWLNGGALLHTDDVLAAGERIPMPDIDRLIRELDRRPWVRLANVLTDVVPFGAVAARLHRPDRSDPRAELTATVVRIVALGALEDHLDCRRMRGTIRGRSHPIPVIALADRTGRFGRPFLVLTESSHFGLVDHVEPLPGTGADH